MSLEYAQIFLNLSILSTILDEIKLKIFFGMFVGYTVRKAKLLTIRFYLLDLNLTPILIYFRDMIVI
jgi:hypothetical protein